MNFMQLILGIFLVFKRKKKEKKEMSVSTGETTGQQHIPLRDTCDGLWLQDRLGFAKSLAISKV